MARPLVTWSPLKPDVPCPNGVCGETGYMEARQVEVPTDGEGVLSPDGGMLTLPTEVRWRYRCLACGAEGWAEPNESPEEQEEMLERAYREQFGTG